MKYQQWINDNVPKYCKGECVYWCNQMMKVFPELKIQVYRTGNGKRHVWLIDPENNIVDPTANQFDPTAKDYDYSPNLDKLPVGKCLECSKLIFEGTFCNSFCENQYIKQCIAGGE